MGRGQQLPTTTDNIEVVQPVKHESEAHGGAPGSSAIPYPEPIEPLVDGLEAAALFVVETGRRNKNVAIWTNSGDLKFKDVANPGVGNVGFTLTDLLASSGGITEAQHKALRQLIHFIDEGPAESFASGAYKETTPTGPFPTSEIWWESSSKLKKIVSLDTTWSGAVITQEVWKIYDTDGSTVLATVTDAVSYSGIFETSRTRTIA